MLCGVLHDQEGIMRVSYVVVPASADWNTLEQIVAAVKRLPQLQQIGFAGKFDAELPSHRTGATVAADEILCAQRDVTFGRLHARRDGAGVLRERKELAAVAYVQRGHGFGARLKQRL